MEDEKRYKAEWIVFVAIILLCGILSILGVNYVNVKVRNGPHDEIWKFLDFVKKAKFLSTEIKTGSNSRYWSDAVGFIYAYLVIIAATLIANLITRIVKGSYDLMQLHFSIPVVIMAIVCASLSACGAGRWFLFGAGMTAGFGEAIFISAGLCNIDYQGPKPMKYYQKVLEVFVQIALLPISAFIEFTASCIFICASMWCSGPIVRHLFYIKLKGEEFEDGELYRDTPSATVTISSSSVSVKYDDGVRYEESEQEKRSQWHCFLFFPLRLMSLMLSIVALFSPYLYIKVRRPKNVRGYNETCFIFFDLIKFD